MRRFRDAADSQVKRTKRVSTSNFATDEKVGLSQIRSALPDSRSPGGHRVNSNLSSLIDTDGIEIESLDGKTRKLDEPIQHTLLPLSKTILHGSELGQLTHPIRMHTESFKISVLIKVRSLAPIRRDGVSGISQHGTIFEIERGEDTGRVPGIVDLGSRKRPRNSKAGKPCHERRHTWKSLYSLKPQGMYFCFL